MRPFHANFTTGAGFRTSVRASAVKIPSLVRSLTLDHEARPGPSRFSTARSILPCVVPSERSASVVGERW